MASGATQKPIELILTKQLATYLGWLMHGVWGGLAAGLLFILPGALVMLALSILYVTLGHVPIVASLFFGLKCAVLVLVVEALIRIGRRALKGRAAYAMAIAAFLALFVLHLPFPLVVIGAGAFNRNVTGRDEDTGSLFYVNGSHARAVDDRWSYKLSAGYFTQDPLPRPFGVIPNQFQTPYPDLGNTGTSQPKFDARVDYDFAGGDRGRLTFAGGVAGTEGIIHSGVGPFDIDSDSRMTYFTGRYERGARRIAFFSNLLDGNAINLLARGSLIVLTPPLIVGPEHIDEAIQKKASLVEIIPGKGSGALKKKVLRFLDQREIKQLYHRVEKDGDNWGRLFVHFRHDAPTGRRGRGR